MNLNIDRVKYTSQIQEHTTTCRDCPSETIAKEIAIRYGLAEYLIVIGDFHTRKRLDGSIVAHAKYTIKYWHAFVRAVLPAGKRVSG